MNKKVLIFGGSGFIGSKLIELRPNNFNVIATYNTHKQNIAGIQWTKCDLLDSVQVEKILQAILPDLVINATKTDLQALDPIISFIKRNNLRYIHLSSDAVFDGQKGNYKENDLPNPVNNYGKAKLEEEKLIAAALKNFVIVRTSYVYGNSSGVWDKRTQNLIKQKSISAYTNMYRSPTRIDILANALWKILLLKYQGILHIAGNKMNMPEFFKMLAKMINKDIEIQKQLCNETIIALDTSLNTDLSKSINL